MFIDGIGIAGYRSFGPEMQRIGPFGKINLIIGPNNSGKSNFLRFLRNHYPKIVKREDIGIDELDKHLGSVACELDYELAIKVDGELHQKLIEKLVQRRPEIQNVLKLLRKVFTSDIFTHNTPLFWFPRKVTAGQAISENLINEIHDKQIISNHDWKRLWSSLTNRDGGGIKEHWIPDGLKSLYLNTLFTSTVSLIPAIREIIDGDGESNGELMSGKGLVKQLAKLESPRHNEGYLRLKFKKINKFLQIVTGNQSARIEIPSEQDIIQVDMDGRTLPLSSLGTGIHEVIILASAATIVEDQILCVEEPEIHLHPLLQKKLLEYLSKNTNNQYFIATHSAHLLDLPDVSIFRIQLENGVSIVDLAVTDSHKSKICDELGYKASDLLQSNYIIWVEGPSDRIYLNHWIHSKDDTLVEGIHYSIMFYGGRLLSHLSADDEEVQSFIDLRRMNRHLGIMIDSDRENSNDEINDTKKRIKKEFESCSDFVWITEGKEIENYLNPETIQTAISSMCGDDVEITKYSKFNSCIKYRKGEDAKYKTADKVKLANYIAEVEPDFSVYDLDAKVNELVEYIRAANDLG